MNTEYDGPRPPFDQEIPELLRFLKNSLRPEKPWGFQQEYPLVFQESNIKNLRIIKSGDEVLSHAAVKPLLIKTPMGLLKIAGIGSVVTSEEHRQQGLSLRTLQSCLETALHSGCELGILWTNLYDFYRKLGFELAGTEVHLKITDRFQPPQWPGYRVVKGAQVDPQALLRLFSKHRVSSLRKESEIISYLKIPSTRVYTCWADDGTLNAYAIEGKGADLDGYIHEWAGGVKGLSLLMQQMFQDQSRDLVLLTPKHSENLIRTLESYGAQRTDGFLGMIKLLHTTQLFAKIRKYARQLGVPNLTLEQNEEGFVVGLGDDCIHTQDETDVVKILFGPSRPSEFNVWPPEVSAKLDQVLPLPFWIWGWDSV